MSTAPTMPARRSTPATSTPPASRFSTGPGVPQTNFRVGLYGPEGVGKTALARACPGVHILNAENARQFSANSYVNGVIVPEDYAASWINLRAWVQSLGNGIYCIDSMTRVEDWCATFVIKTKKSNEGAKATDSIEDFKYKAGLKFVVDEFLRLISDIDNAFMRGASFILIAHDRINKFNNPDGSNFIRHEPRLVHDEKTGSNMLQFVQFLDDLWFIDLDKNVSKGKVEGSGSRTVYLDTASNRISKTRLLPKDPVELIEGSAQLWELLGVTA